MLNRLIEFSIRQRVLIIALAIMTFVYGVLVMPSIDVDVLPDLNRPVVTIMTEAHGLGPEETEALVSFPIETMMNGATGVERVRSASSAGFSIVFVEFDWSMDIFRARQIVNEKLQLAQSRLPEDATASLAPISSIMGEIMLVSLSTATGETPPLEVRSLAEFVVRPRLLAIPGVSQVVPIGGGSRQYQVLTTPERLVQYDVSIDELIEAAGQSNISAGGGFLQDASQESVVRLLGRVEDPEDIAQTVVKTVDGTPITIGQVADVEVAPGLMRGDASVNGSSAVILSIQKQPNANTLKLTDEVDTALDDIEASLPPDVEVNRELFRQEEFINVAIKNVLQALGEATIIVLIVILAFLMNVRATTISILSIPLSFVITALILHRFGISVNTMTLGGLAIAIGLVVDDSIVDVENVFRRLRENAAEGHPRPYLRVILEASKEIRNSIVFATIIIVTVFIPLLSLEGMEGRVFRPLGIAFIVSMTASLLVSLTVTPALCAVLLKKTGAGGHAKDGWLLAGLKKLVRPAVKWSMRNAWLVVSATVIVSVAVMALTPLLGREFLPPFNEGSLSVTAILPPGTNIKESNRIVQLIEKETLQVPEVTHVGRRTGRAEMDEHAEGVNHSEIDIGLEESERGQEAAVEDLRQRLDQFPGVYIAIGQPISHRLDHLSSGVRAALAVKVFGPDLVELRRLAEQVRGTMATVPGIVDLQVEPQVEVPQVSIEVDRTQAARYGVTPEDLVEYVDVGLGGHSVSQVLKDQQTYDLVVWFEEGARGDIDSIRSLLVDTPTGHRVPLAQLASIHRLNGPNTINRENVSRRIVVQANISGRDLNSIVTELRSKLDPLARQWPDSYFVEYGGQFESQQSAMRRVMLLGAFTVVLIYLLLFVALRSWRMALQVMVNLPLATVGGILAVFLTGGVLSVASLVGFITLFGIATRNGIMMLSHYAHLMRYEGEVFGEKMILRGTLERLSPVLMTALAASLGLLPLAIALGEAGKELLQPIAVVILGGLVTSTLLDQIVTPALFWIFGRKEWEGFDPASLNADPMD